MAARFGGFEAALSLRTLPRLPHHEHAADEGAAEAVVSLR
jgi:hypothetical protein